MKTPAYILIGLLALTISLRLIVAETPAENHSTRLLIGFHSDQFSGEDKSINFLNKRLKSDSVIRMLRPINDKTALITIENTNPNTLSADIKKLLALKEVRFIEIDQTMRPMPKNNTAPLR